MTGTSHGRTTVSDLVVIGIDPAPSKTSAIYDPRRCAAGESPFADLPAAILSGFLDGLAGQNVLICWDAPLTGPHEPDGEPSNWSKSDHSTRDIEFFFTRKEHWPVPDGISVRGYGGCPHWTITRRLLGLPRVGKYDSPNIPFALVTAPASSPAFARASVVEVHPALALWLWIRTANDKEEDKRYRYKGDARKRTVTPIDLLKDLEAAKPGGSDPEVVRGFEEVKKDLADCRPDVAADHLDAFVAWLLGHLWSQELQHANGKPAVVLLGDAARGCMLLPNVPELVADFESFDPAKKAKRLANRPSAIAG